MEYVQNPENGNIMFALPASSYSDFFFNNGYGKFDYSSDEYQQNIVFKPDDSY